MCPYKAQHSAHLFLPCGRILVIQQLLNKLQLYTIERKTAKKQNKKNTHCQLYHLGIETIVEFII